MKKMLFSTLMQEEMLVSFDYFIEKLIFFLYFYIFKARSGALELLKNCLRCQMMEEEDVAKLMKAAALSLGFPTSEAESLANSMNTPSVVHQLRLNHKVEVIEYEKETDEEYGIAICEVCKEQEPEEERLERIKLFKEKMIYLTKLNKNKSNSENIIKDEKKVDQNKVNKIEDEVSKVDIEKNNNIVVKEESKSDHSNINIDQIKNKFIHCTTCTLAFHFKCFRPILTEMPGAKWSCPFCILDVSYFQKFFLIFFFEILLIYLIIYLF